MRLVLLLKRAVMESYNAVLLRELAVKQMRTLTALNISNLPQLTDGERG